MPIVETYYRLDVKGWDASEDTVEVVMDREAALRAATEILETLAGDASDHVTVAITGSLVMVDAVEESP